MSSRPRYFQNPFPDHKPGIEVKPPEDRILQLLQHYVAQILKYTSRENNDRRGDLYVGNSGIAFMFYKLSQSRMAANFPDALNCAGRYIDESLSRAEKYKNRDGEKVSFLCGNAGIYAVSAAISFAQNNRGGLAEHLTRFSQGFDVCRRLQFNDYGNDEILFGRAGYLSAAYWLNQVINPPPFTKQQVLEVCETMYESGKQYSAQHRLKIPLMYECYGDQYVGAAHGISAIFHMFLESPMIHQQPDKGKVIKESIDYLLSLQDAEGNFPAAMDEVGQHRSYSLVHWCHGAPGVVYILAKAYLTYQEPKYLEACHKCAELVWRKGLLLKGPGICHGVAGNAYVFLLMFRLTNDPKHLYRAIQFFEFLQNDDFLNHARTPDHPFSLYEGIAGTACFLIDLLEPDKAEFPFMDVFKIKC